MKKKKPISAKDIHVTGDFIAGDQYNYYYTGDFASLAEYYISPEPVFQRVRTDDFIGRDWLTAKVDAFLNDPNRKSGAFLIIGDAGVGKTSFMAHLVKERRYLHLFAEQAPGQAMLQRAMQSLGSQLVTRYQIDPYKDRDTLNALSVFPDFLERILRLAASTLTEGEKIVIVCDALDEAGTFPDHFVFGLPKELPDGVYFILSQRPVNVKLPNFEPVVEKLEAQGEGNMQDMQAYLSAVAKRPEVAGQIRSKEYSEELFIQTLKEKSQGVWMYLHYIIKEIESGARAPLDLANLPTGLVGYYAEYWDAWRTGKRGKGEEAWDELYAPLLTTLAAAQEAIPIDWLIQWADVTAKPREVTRLLTEHWRAFITEKEKDGQKTYAPYHLSFKDFITGRVDTGKLPPAQANLVKDLAAQTVDAHKCIVNTFEKECNGEWEKLVEQDYPCLHLTAHLNGAGEYEKLRIMLTEGDEKIKWAVAREKKEETYAGYLNDLTYVWDYAEREQNFALAIRCMLIENSIHSLAANIPPDLLAELAKAGLWSYERCLSTIREKTDSNDIENSLRLIMPDLPSSLLQEVLIAARQIKSESTRTGVLISIIPRLGEEIKTQVLQEALLSAREIKHEDSRASALMELAPLLNEELKPQILQEALITARKINDESSCASTLAKLAPLLDEKLRAQVLQEALTVAREIKYESSRASALAKLALLLNEELRPQVLQEALDMAYEIKSDFFSRGVIANIASHLNEELKSKVLQEILTTAYEIKEESARAYTLVELMPYLSENLKPKAIQEVLTTARKINEESFRALVIVDLIPYLSENLKPQVVQETLTTARKIKDSHTLKNLLPFLENELKSQVAQEALFATYKTEDEFPRAKAMTVLAIGFTKKLKNQVFQEILDIIRNIRNEHPRAIALENLSPYLNEDLRIQALSIAREIKYEDSRASALAGIASHLSEGQKQRLLQEALKAAREIKDEFIRSRTLVNIAPLLNKDQRSQVLQEALDAARKIKETHFHAEALTNLIPHNNGKLKLHLLQEALAVAREINDEDKRASALVDLAPYHKGELKLRALQEALAIAREIKDEFSRTSALAGLVPHLEDNLKPEVIQETLTAAHEIKYESHLALALLDIVPYLNEETKISFFQKILFSGTQDFILSLYITQWRKIEFSGLEKKIIPFIKFMAQKKRDEGVGALGSIIPALIYFSGESITKDLLSTIQDTARWWQ